MALAQKIHQLEPEHLVARCRQGDRAAQAALYQRYSRAMFSICLRMVGRREEAEDLLQEIFVDAFTHLHTYEGKATFGAWLKRITVNHCISALRKRQVQFDLDATPNPAAPEDHSPEPEYSVEAVQRAMSQLADGYRAVLSLYLFEGYDHEEIAQILNIAPSTSKTQYKRGKEKLVQLLKQ